MRTDSQHDLRVVPCSRVFLHTLVFDVGRVSDDDIEAACAHDSKELGKPMERLVALLPLLELLRFVRVHAVLARKVAIQFLGKAVQPAAKLLLLRGELAGVHAVFGLHLVELLEGAIDDFRLLDDAIRLGP